MKKLGSGQNIIFFHGGLVKYNAYLSLIRELAKDFTVYYFNLPGHGTEHTDGYPSHTIDEILKKIEIEEIERPILIGHSLGGFYAYEIAHRMKTINKVILLNPLLIQHKNHLLQLIYLFCFRKNVRAIWINYKISFFLIKTFVDLIMNIFQQKLHFVNTAKLLIRVAYYKKSLFEDNFDLVILHGKDDSVISLREMRNDFSSSVQPIDGEHDWCMNDVEKTVKEIKKYL